MGARLAPAAQRATPSEFWRWPGARAATTNAGAEDEQKLRGQHTRRGVMFPAGVVTRGRGRDADDGRLLHRGQECAARALRVSCATRRIHVDLGIFAIDLNS